MNVISTFISSHLHRRRATFPIATSFVSEKTLASFSTHDEQKPTNFSKISLKNYPSPRAELFSRNSFFSEFLGNCSWKLVGTQKNVVCKWINWWRILISTSLISVKGLCDHLNPINNSNQDFRILLSWSSVIFKCNVIFMRVYWGNERDLPSKKVIFRWFFRFLKLFFHWPFLSNLYIYSNENPQPD